MRVLSMPRGAGTTYDHPYVRLCVEEILNDGLESGDMFDARTLAFMMTQYRGLSIKDINKKFVLPEGTLMSSKVYFMRIANEINEESEPKIFRKRTTRSSVVLVCGRVKRNRYFCKN